MENEIINKIRDLELHDNPMLEILLNFEKKEVTIVYEIYDEDNRDYIKCNLIFYGVSKFENSEVFSNNMNMDEIFGVNCKQINENDYLAEIILLGPPRDPDWVLYVTFKDIKSIIGC